MAPLRVAIAGAGMVSRHHLIAWSNCPNAQVVGIADPDIARARARAAEFGIPASFAHASAMLETTRPDALDIAASHEAHESLCELAAARGVAILCQKPLAPTLDAAERIAGNVGERVRLMVHENFRHRPWYRQAHAWLAEGAIGKLRHAVFTARGAGLVPDAQGRLPALVRQPMLAGIPRLMIGEVLVHHLDVACWLAGPLTLDAARLRRDVAAVRGESAATLLLHGDDARTVIVDGDIAVPEAPARVDDAMELFGTDGAIRLAGSAVTLSRADDPTRTVRHDSDLAYQQSYDAAIAHFVHALCSDTPFETPADAHLRVLALVEEAYRLDAAARA